jgi:hypothetical protein
MMPRFHLSDSELTALATYLFGLGIDNDIGVSESEIRIGSLRPPVDGVNQVLRAYFKEVNERGGIFGRRISLHTDIADDAVTESDVFALVASRPKESSDRLLAAERIPVVGALGPMPDTARHSQAPVYYLYPGLAMQAQVAIEYIASKVSKEPQVLVVSASPRRKQDWLTGIEGSM